MAFDIAVYRIVDRHRIGEPMPDNPVEYDDWMARHDQMLLFEAPLGSGGAVYHYWSLPAFRLGLPILSSIYETGFTHGVEIEGADLDKLSGELKTLFAEWLRIVSPTETTLYRIGPHELEVPLLADLTWRAETLKTAIRLAQRLDAYISIS